MLGMLSDEYVIKSNKETGKGRYDILLLPRDVSQYGIIIEIKQMENDSTKESIDKKQKKALDQIIDNKYYKELLAHNVNNRIELSMVFVGKEVYIKANSIDK